MEWYKLRLSGIKDMIIKILMDNFETYEDIFKLHRNQLQKYFNLTDEVIDTIYNSKKIDIQKNLNELQKLNIHVVSLKDESYPKILKHIQQPPVFLYYKGDLSLTENERKIAIVGTRTATTYGKNCCEKIVDELLLSNVTIVSGLALGIDGISHNRTLQKKGKTIAVVGSGLDIIYPYTNKHIWERIEKEGLILSEFPLGTPPNSFNFPRRNRIIVGLSKGVCVIESKEKGGSLITAHLALDEGRDVFAVPGDIFSPNSIGTNELIKNSGAKLITSGKDILEEYSWEKQKSLDEVLLNVPMTEYEKIIYKILSVEKSLDEIILESNIKAANLLAILMEMEIKGLVSSVAGGKYRRK